MHRITQRDIARYTQGDCGIFARALNKLTGWPIYTFTSELGAPMFHAFVVDPDGRPVDIEGRWRSMGDFQRRWSQHRMEQWTWEELTAVFPWWRGTHFKNKIEPLNAGHGSWYDHESYSYCRARDLAKLLVDGLDSEPKMR